MHHARRLADAAAHTAPAFFEEPLRPEHSHLIGRLVATTSVPIATGERLFCREEFLPVLAAGIAIAQPDPAHCGGITEAFRIATMAESYDVQIAPHCPIGPVALAACVQLDLAVPNFYAPEHIIDLRSPDSPDLAYLRNPEALVAVSGHLDRPTGPGWASRSTRTPYAPPPAPSRSCRGATRCGATPTAASPNGDARCVAFLRSGIGK